MITAQVIALILGAFGVAGSALGIVIGIQATRIRRARTASRGAADGSGGRLLDPREAPGGNGVVAQGWGTPGATTPALDEDEP